MTSSGPSPASRKLAATSGRRCCSWDKVQNGCGIAHFRKLLAGAAARLYRIKTDSSVETVERCEFALNHDNRDGFAVYGRMDLEHFMAEPVDGDEMLFGEREYMRLLLRRLDVFEPIVRLERPGRCSYPAMTAEVALVDNNSSRYHGRYAAASLAFLASLAFRLVPSAAEPVLHAGYAAANNKDKNDATILVALDLLDELHVNALRVNPHWLRLAFLPPASLEAEVAELQEPRYTLGEQRVTYHHRYATHQEHARRRPGVGRRRKGNRPRLLREPADA